MPWMAVDSMGIGTQGLRSQVQVDSRPFGSVRMTESSRGLDVEDREGAVEF